MASLSGTFTAVQQTTAPLLYLRATETVRTTLTISGSARVSLCRSVGPSQAVVPIETYSASGTYDWVNTTGEDYHLLLLCVSVAGSAAYTFADVAGDQILAEWRAADGTLAFRVTDQGPVLGGVGDAPNDGVTDATTALQRAIDQCPEGGEVVLSGVYRLTSGLTVTTPITIRGTDTRNTNLPDTDSRAMLYFASDVAAGITATANLCMKGVVVAGVGLGVSNGTGIVGTSASVVLEDVLVQAWDTGLSVSAGYYNKLTRFRADYVKVAAKFDNCYNVSAVSSAFLGRDVAGARGVDLLNGSSASFHGCSFESFRASGLALYGGASATLSGCYFEGEPESGDYGFGVIVANNGHVTAIGNHVYLTNLNQRFITVEGGSTTGTRVFSRGNRFIYPTDTQAVDVYTPVATDATSTWDVSGDNWQSDAGANCHYLELTFEGAVAFGTGQYRITYPANHPLAQAPIDTVRPYSSIGAVASAGTLAIPVGARVVTVSGTTGITSITATGHTGRTVTLVFAGILTVTDGSNLRLNGDFSTSADDTLTLVCDGTNWYEMARSAN